MGTKKAGEQNKRVITQNSTGTYSVSLPIELVKQLHWQRRQKVVIKRQGSKLVITDWEG